MLQLKLLGGASLESSTGPVSGPAAQRRRLGVVIRLALAGSAGLTRDKLVGYLWPEADAERARHLLSDAIYRINQAVDVDLILTSHDQLRINPTAITCDALEFSLALQQGEVERAVALYRGPFLDGFFVSGAGELERWIEEERSRLAGEYARALESLALAASQAGDTALAVHHWRRLAAHDRYSSRIALGLVDALIASGDALAARRQGEIHEALLRDELGGKRADEFARAVQDRLDARLPRRHVDQDAVAVAQPTAPAPPQVDQPNAAESTSFRTPGDTVAPSRRRGVVLVLIVLVALVLGWWAVAGRPVAATRPAVAVLPFADLSAGRDQQHLADGFTEELIGTLDRLGGIDVSSRTSVFALQGQPIDVRAVGGRLGVTEVIDGSVRREGNRVRVSVRMANARTGFQTWSDSYDRELTGIFAIQEEVARAVARELRVRLGAGAADVSPEHPPENFEAYNLYLRGRFHWHRRTEADLQAAVQAFQSAVAMSPGYHRAWAGLADAYAILGFYDWSPPTEVFPLAREAALRASESGPLRGEAEATLGYVRFYFDWDWLGAEDHFRAASRAQPTLSKAHQWHANYLTGMGRFSEAEQAMRTAMELEPLSLIANAALCWIWYHARRFGDAIHQCARTMALDGDYFLAHLWRGWAWSGLAQWDSAEVALTRAVVLSDHGTIALSGLAYVVGKGGRPDSASAILEVLRRRAAEGYEPAYELAKAALGAGRQGEALRLLEQALADRGHSMVFLKTDPQLDDLRGDPRFAALIERVGLP